MPLRYTDRSRHETGLERCPHLRYLKYHAGPAGYGFEKAARSMPLILGGGATDALAEIRRHIMTTDSIANLNATIREQVEYQKALYKKKVLAFGMQQVGEVDETALNLVITEQCALLTGMVWAWCLEILPWFHEEFRIIGIEIEEEYVINCTCGLGSGMGSFGDHEARACTGIGIQGRNDVLTAKRTTDSIAWHDDKTTAWPGETWEAKWEVNLQFAMGMLCAERRLGVEISEHYVHGLFKGQRKKRRMPGDVGKINTGPKFQDSPFCVAYRRPANPPMEPEDWKVEYWFVGTDGKNHSLGKTYEKAPIWEYPCPKPDMDPAEYWVRFIPAEVRRSQVQVLGPLNRQALMIEMLPDELAGEEDRWTEILHKLHAAASGIGPTYWTDPRFQKTLSRLVPKSYACRRFGKEQQCEMFGICTHQPGWEDPFEGGVYRLRAPHHAAERAQMAERGLAPPELDERED